jgi:hypothetical protein
VSFTLTSIKTVPVLASRLGLRIERGVEIARPETFEVQGDIAVPGGTYSSDKLVAPRNCIG